MERRPRVEQRQPATVLQLVVRVPALLMPIEQRVHVQVSAAVHVTGVAVAVRVPERQVPKYGADHITAPAELAHNALELCGRGGYETGRARHALRYETGRRAVTSDTRDARNASSVDGRRPPVLWLFIFVATHVRWRGTDQLAAAGSELLQQWPALLRRLIVVQRQGTLSHQYRPVDVALGDRHHHSCGFRRRFRHR